MNVTLDLGAPHDVTPGVDWSWGVMANCSLIPPAQPDPPGVVRFDFLNESPAHER